MWCHTSCSCLFYINKTEGFTFGCICTVCPILLFIVQTSEVIAQYCGHELQKSLFALSLPVVGIIPIPVRCSRNHTHELHSLYSKGKYMLRLNSHTSLLLMHGLCLLLNPQSWRKRKPTLPLWEYWHIFYLRSISQMMI